MITHEIVKILRDISSLFMECYKMVVIINVFFYIALTIRRSYLNL